MNNEWDNALIAQLENTFSEAGMYTNTENINDNNVLVIEYGGENAPEDCNISVLHLTEDTTQISILFSIASGLDKETTAKVSELLPYLNKYLTLGNFGVTASDGYFYFNCAFMIDEATDREMLIKLILATLDICANTAEEAVVIFNRIKSGGQEVSSLMNDDTAIVQF